MRKIYLVLTYSGTVLSKIIKVYTRYEYSHISISLDENLDDMYSFARLTPYNPFIGGFVQESPNYGTFKRFYKTKTKIYSLTVNDEQYKKIKKIIKSFNNSKTEYRFNLLGCIAVAFNLKIKRENHFYCAEFVKHVLDKSDLKLKLPELIKPQDFQSIKGLEEIYSGRLSEYNTIRCE